MRAQVALDALITATAMAVAVLGIIGAYYKVWNVISDGLAEKRLNYAVALIKDAAQGCSGSEYAVHLPYNIDYKCGTNHVTISIGEKEQKIKGIRCGAGVSSGTTQDISVANCVFRPIT
ncbi:MAG: hypothetical protein GXN93_00280 [Candidatus Diapherotrites archaeon]|nr:hypothetical protein [Candidatus Diapherotrites archaeon]